MIGSLNVKQRQVTVVGGGISGLLAAYELDRAGFEVTLFEASDRLGGLIRTTRTPIGIAEAAAHSLLMTAEAESLFADLGIKPFLVAPESKARFIYRGGRLRRFPLSLIEALGTFLRALLARSNPEPDGEKGQTLAEWATRHLGDPALKYLMNPFVRGIYGQRPSELDLAAAFPSLVVPRGRSLLGHFIRKKLAGLGSKKTPRAKMVALEQGMGALTEALATRLTQRLGERLHLNSPLERVPDAPNVILAVPAHAAAKLLDSQDAELAYAVRAIRYVPMLSVTALVRRDSLVAFRRGVGVLIPEAERGRECLGILFNSSAFCGRATEGWESFTVMLGGSSDPEAPRLSDEAIRSRVERELRALVGYSGGPLELVIHRWFQAIPAYDARLRDALELAARSWCSNSGHILAGNWTGQVSLRGMIADSAALARSAR